MNFLAASFSFVSRLPLSVSKYIMKSLARDHNGYLNVAGLFFSKKKCPTQANPYPAKGTYRKLDHV